MSLIKMTKMGSPSTIYSTSWKLTKIHEIAASLVLTALRVTWLMTAYYNRCVLSAIVCTMSAALILACSQCILRHVRVRCSSSSAAHTSARTVPLIDRGVLWWEAHATSSHWSYIQHGLPLHPPSSNSGSDSIMSIVHTASLVMTDVTECTVMGGSCN